MAKTNTTQLVNSWGEHLTSQGVMPALAVSHYIDKGHQFWSTKTKEDLDAEINWLYNKEKEDEQNGIIHFVSASFIEAASRAAYDLARLESRTRIKIIKKYII